MAYQPKRRKMTAEINVVPYIDVMLVLLIIFMVTAPFVTQASMSIYHRPRRLKQRQSWRKKKTAARSSLWRWTKTASSGSVSTMVI